MDKRWILIIIILIVGISSLYVIADNSMRIGKAITTMDNVIITLPPDFKVDHKSDAFIELINRNNDEKISIDLIKEKNKTYELMKNKLIELQLENVDNIENYTQNVSNITVYSIKYENLTHDTPVNYTVNYVNKLNKTFIITTSDYDDVLSEQEDLEEIIKTLRLDFKVKDE